VKALLTKLGDWGVRRVTVSTPFLLELVKCCFPEFKVRVGIYAQVDTPRRARFWPDMASPGMTLPGGRFIRAARSCWPKSPRNWNLPMKPCGFPTTSSRTMATCHHPPFCLSCGRSWTATGHNPAIKECSSHSAPGSRPSRRSWNLCPLELRQRIRHTLPPTVNL